jgi:hypothetical protein
MHHHTTEQMVPQNQLKRIHEITVKLMHHHTTGRITGWFECNGVRSDSRQQHQRVVHYWRAQPAAQAAAGAVVYEDTRCTAGLTSGSAASLKSGSGWVWQLGQVPLWCWTTCSGSTWLAADDGRHTAGLTWLSTVGRGGLQRKVAAACDEGQQLVAEGGG